MNFAPNKQIVPKAVSGVQLSYEWLVLVQAAAAIKALYFFYE